MTNEFRWLEAINEVIQKFPLECKRTWVTMRRAGTTASAREIVNRNNLRFPKYLWRHRRTTILFHLPASESIVEMAERRDQEGYEKYGDKWDRDPVVEAKEELADAYNYIQWARHKGQIEENEERELLGMVMKTFQKLRAYAEAPEPKSPSKYYVSGAQTQRFAIQRTIRPERKKDE